MFSYVFMKILEGRPRSYDRVMDTASAGRVLRIKQSVASEIPENARVLEVGCGTGELAVMCLDRGAVVDGFDLNSGMVEVARERIATRGLKDKFTVHHMGVEGMDGFSDGTYDAVISTLVFSELSDDQRRFALKHAFRVLKAGGRLVIADEVVPRALGKRMLLTITRVPLLIVTFLLSGSSTRPIADLAGEVSAAGFSMKNEKRSHGDAFALVVGVKKEGK